jgi:hypothetical protein
MGFCANEIYQTMGGYYDVNNSTSTAIVVSSTTFTTSSKINNGYGTFRIFKILGSPTAILYFQLGGDPATILSNGMVLDNGIYYVEDTYFGDIYFKATGGSVNLRVITLTRS